MDRAVAFYTGCCRSRRCRTTSSPGAVRTAAGRLRRAQPCGHAAAGHRRDRADRVPRAEGPADPADIRANDRAVPAHRDRRQRHREGVRPVAGAPRRARVHRSAAAAGLEPERRRDQRILLPRSRSPLSRNHLRSRRTRALRNGTSRPTGCSLASITPRSSSTTPRRRCAFYRDTLGMQVAGESENYDVEQEHLNNVFGARLRITALRARKGPGHRAARIPRAARRPAGAGRSARERHRALADDAGRRAARPLLSLARDHRITLVSPGPVETASLPLGFRAGALTRDPDGHGDACRRPIARRNTAASGGATARIAKRATLQRRRRRTGSHRAAEQQRRTKAARCSARQTRVAGHATKTRSRKHQGAETKTALCLPRARFRCVPGRLRRPAVARYSPFLRYSVPPVIPLPP